MMSVYLLMKIENNLHTPFSQKNRRAKFLLKQDILVSTSHR